MMTNTTTDPYATNWKVDDEGLLDCGGQVGGDYQATDAWTFRFVQITEPDDGLHAFVEEHWFGEQFEDGTYGVTGMHELMICTDAEDPGGTEEWCDYIYDTDADVRVYESIEAVAEAARRAAQRSMSMPYAWCWDGRTRDIRR